MKPDQGTISRILQILRFKPKGITITDLSRELKVNRNSVAKYLEILQISGQVEKTVIGNAKIYSLAKRLPISTMLSCSTDFIVVLDQEGKIVQINESFLRFLHKSEEDITGKHLDDLSLPLLSEPDLVPLIFESLEGRECSREVCFREGSANLYFRSKGIPTVLEEGENGATIIFENNTEQKNAEEALRLSEERYRNITEWSHDIIYDIDTDGIITYISPSVTRVLGMNPDDIIGKDYRTFNAEIWKSDGRSLFQKALQGKVCENIELVINRSDGTRVFLEANLAPRFENGKISSIQGITRDITERKKSLEAQALLASIVASSEDAIIGKSPDGSIISWNAGAERLYGYTEAEAVGRNLSFIIPPERQQELSRAQKSLEKGFPQHFETERLRKDGSTVDVSLTISPIFDPNGTIVGASTIARDISEKKRVERAKQEYTKNLAFLSGRAMDFVEMDENEDFFGFVADTIRSLVPGSIVGVCEYEKKSGSLIPRAIKGEKEEIEAIIHCSETIREIRLPVSQRVQKILLTGELVEVPSLEHLTFNQIPAEIADALRDRLDIGRIFAIAFKAKDELLGGAALLLKNGVDLKEKDLLEAFIHQSSVALQRRLAQEARRSSEDKTNDLFNAIPITALLVDPEGTLITCNDTAFSCIKKTSKRDLSGKEEIIGRNFEEFSHPDIIEQRLEAFSKAARTGQPVYFEESLKGRIHNNTIFPISAPDGELKTLAIFSEDITRWKTAEKELRASQRKLSDIIDFLPDATFVVNGNHEVMAWNRAMEQMTGVAKQDILGKKDYSYSVPFYGKKRPLLIDYFSKSAEELQTYYPNVRREETTLYTEVFCPLLYQGKGAYLWVNASAILDESGNIVGGIESIRDISVVRRAQALLNENEARYRNLIESMPDGMITVDQGYRIVYANRAAAENMQMTREEMMGKHLSELLPPRESEAFIGILERIFRTKQVFQKEGSIELAGREKWFGNHFIPLIDDAGKNTLVLVISRDVTGQKEGEKALKMMNERLNTLINVIPDPVYIKDLSGHHLLVNSAFQSLTGKKKEEIIGKKNSDLLPPDLARHCDRSDEEVIQRRKIVKVTEYSDVLGLSTVFETIKVPHIDEDGNVDQLICVSRDITERVRTESALQEVQNQLDTEIEQHAREVLEGKERLSHEIIEYKRALKLLKEQTALTVQTMDLLGLVMVELNPLGTILMINKQGSDVLGYRERDLLDKNWFDIIIPEKERAEVRNLHQYLLKGNLDASVKMHPVLNRNGEHKDFVWLLKSIRDDAHTPSSVLWIGESPPGKTIHSLHKRM